MAACLREVEVERLAAHHLAVAGAQACVTYSDRGRVTVTSPSDPHALTLLLRKLESIGELSAEDRQAILTLPIRPQVLT